MAASGGFNFGTPAGGGGTGGAFSFGTPKTAGGLTAGLATTTASAGASFTFGTTATPKTATVAPTVGFSLGTTPGMGSTGTPSVGGFQLGAAPLTSTGVTSSSSSAGLSLGGLTSGATPGLGGTPATSTSAGFTLGGTSTSTGLTGGATPASTGLTLGATTATTGLALGATSTASTGFTLGGATTTSTGLTLGATTTTSKPGGVSFGGISGATTASSGLTLGAATTSTTTSVFGTGTPSTVSRGLGGIDPKTTQSGSSGSAASDKPGDSKAIKETQVDVVICATVEEFKKYVKEQKTTREQIMRMSTKSHYKVQEEVAMLQQLLSLVSNGLQRNALAIHKLKDESAQELKHAEIAQRTRDTPPGLQYENVTPAEYFQCLVQDFEVRMMTYRQQIEEMESHLASLNQSSMLTPQELSSLLAKLHQSFLALAAQLQMVHNTVKAQKEHFLNYRKVFHGDTTDIFQKCRKAEERTGSRVVVTTVGPTPFTGMSNAAAVAMANALNRMQPTAPPTAASGLGFAGSTALGQTVLGRGGTTSLFGSGGGGLTSGFGTASTTAPTLTGFGATATQTATVRPLAAASGTAGGLFGSTPQTGSLGFGTAGTSSLGFGTPAAGTPGLSAPGTIQLAKPPAGNKRGKR